MLNDWRCRPSRDIRRLGRRLATEHWHCYSHSLLPNRSDRSEWKAMNGRIETYGSHGSYGLCNGCRAWMLMMMMLTMVHVVHGHSPECGSALRTELIIKLRLPPSIHVKWGPLSVSVSSLSSRVWLLCLGLPICMTERSSILYAPRAITQCIEFWQELQK